MRTAIPTGGEAIMVWRAALSALCACLIGLGLARFAYTPLIPALIDQGWFPPSQAAYLGAANLAGYLAGALFAGRMHAANIAATIRVMMLVAAASFFACAYPLPFAWFFVWRFASGFAGAMLLVLATIAVLSHVPAGRRGRVGGTIFSGVGIGVAGSGTLVPLLMRAGLTETWLSLGLLALALTVVGWNGWPPEPAVAPVAASLAQPAPKPRASRALLLLCAEYALNAAGLVPHMVFLVDFVARGLGRGLAVGGHYWAIFGVGALIGPLLGGAIADRIGFRLTLRAALLVQILVIALLAVTDRPAALAISSLGVGLFVPGLVPLVLGRMHELVHDAHARKLAWGWCTTAFAAGQAVAAYGFSFLFAQSGGDYAVLFALGAAAVFVAFILDLAQDMTRDEDFTQPRQSANAS